MTQFCMAVVEVIDLPRAQRAEIEALIFATLETAPPVEPQGNWFIRWERGSIPGTTSCRELFTAETTEAAQLERKLANIRQAQLRIA
ncbi:MAG: hypothetical protein Q3976_04190 [Corynebacterium sp.]|nr:hypothetical protein [Corynebacterium sp.]